MNWTLQELKDQDLVCRRLVETLSEGEASGRFPVSQLALRIGLDGHRESYVRSALVQLKSCGAIEIDGSADFGIAPTFIRLAPDGPTAEVTSPERRVTPASKLEQEICYFLAEHRVSSEHGTARIDLFDLMGVTQADRVPAINALKNLRHYGVVAEKAGRYGQCFQIYRPDYATAPVIRNSNRQPAPSTAAPEEVEMKDEKRFPLLAGYLANQPDGEFLVRSGDHATVPGGLYELLRLQRGDIVRLRQVMRRMATIYPGTILEDHDGGLLLGWAEPADDSSDDGGLVDLLEPWEPETGLADSVAGALSGHVVDDEPPIMDDATTSSVDDDVPASSDTELPDDQPVVVKRVRTSHKLSVVPDLPRFVARPPKFTPQQRNQVRNFKEQAVAARKRGNEAAATQWLAKIDEVYSQVAEEQATA